MRRKEDAEATRVAISKMEEEVNWWFDGNNEIIHLLHQS